MKWYYGDNEDNYIAGTSGSDISYGLGGDDQFIVSLDGKTPYAQDRLYGGKGDDQFIFTVNERVLQALESGDLLKPIADGGAGSDRAITEYDGTGSVDVRDIRSVADLHSVENWGYHFYFSAGTIEGTSESEWLSVKSAGKTTVEAGGGNDRIQGFQQDGQISIDGGAGRDILDGRYVVGSGRPEVSGGAGNDLFVFTGWGRVDSAFGQVAQGMIVEDFTRGHDKLVIDLNGSYYFWSENSFHGKADADSFREYIDYNDKTGVLSVNGHEQGIIEGTPRLNASDFLFI